MSQLAQMLANAVWTRGLAPEERQRIERETFLRVFPKGGCVFRVAETVENLAMQRFRD